MNDFPIIDAHHHFWDLERNYLPWLCDQPPVPFRYGDYSSLRGKNYLCQEYQADWGEHAITRSVYVETEWDPRDPIGETRWIHAQATHNARAGSALPHAVVAQAWLDSADAAEVLKAQAAFPLVRGIRHKPTAAPGPDDVLAEAPGSMDDPRWREGYALLEEHNLSFDLQTPWWHLDAAARLARDFPHTQLILNHTGLPADRSAEGLAGWRKAMEGLAAHPNACVKISGLGRLGLPWTVAANGPIVRDTIAIFGAERCMFASNFPVDGLVADFSTIFTGFRAITEPLGPTVQRALFHDNAARFYRMD